MRFWNLGLHLRLVGRVFLVWTSILSTNAKDAPINTQASPEFRRKRNISERFLHVNPSRIPMVRQRSVREKAREPIYECDWKIGNRGVRPGRFGHDLCLGRVRLTFQSTGRRAYNKKSDIGCLLERLPWSEFAMSEYPDVTRDASSRLWPDFANLVPNWCR